MFLLPYWAQGKKHNCEKICALDIEGLGCCYVVEIYKHSTFTKLRYTHPASITKQQQLFLPVLHLWEPAASPLTLVISELVHLVVLLVFLLLIGLPS